jgi:hypothetical protein
MLTAVDENDEWYRPYFTETEIRELREAEQDILTEFEPSDYHILFSVSVPELHLVSILGHIWQTWCNTGEQEYCDFLFAVGANLAEAYLYDPNIEYDEEISEYATMFLKDFTLDDEDDDDEDDEDEDDDLV